MIEANTIICGDSRDVLPQIETESVHLILSDIPYGIGFDEWDVLHANTNRALLGASPAQKRAGAVFQKRGKPLNGWSKADKEIPRQYYEWVCSWVDEWFRVLKPGGTALVFAGRRLAHRCICAFEDVGFTYKDMLAWVKETAPMRAQRISVVFDRRGEDEQAKRWRGWRVGNLQPLFEPILWFVKPYRIGGTIADSVIENNLGAFNLEAFERHFRSHSNILTSCKTKQDTGLHPTQKPLSLMTGLIDLVTREKQLVLDPFCGSGTTALAAKILKRRYIGVEIEERYCSIAKERIELYAARETNSLFSALN